MEKRGKISIGDAASHCPFSPSLCSSKNRIKAFKAMKDGFFAFHNNFTFNGRDGPE